MLENLESALQAKVGSNPEIYISLHTDRSVPVEYVVNVMNIAAKNQYKLILATTPK